MALLYISLRFLHVRDHRAQLQNLRVRCNAATHRESHLHVVGLLLSLTHAASRALDQVFKLLVARLERQSLAIIKVFVLRHP